MAKFITKTKIKEIFKEHKRADISPETEAWVEQILTDLMLQIQEEQEIREEKLATKDDLKLLIEKMEVRFEKVDEKFEYLIKEMNLRFENVDARFEAMQKEMNTRFEALQKEMNARFESTQKQMYAIQQESNARFEALDKRFTLLTWTMNIGFTMIAIIVGLINLLKN
ncbi:MAG: hypothetical protein KatS3mg035_1235 [Bacteroidia bacterium]|nr:MAG: hypothetical protein KatS3mg035_1235 [Bacteroidia bacterium]